MPLGHFLAFCSLKLLSRKQNALQKDKGCFASFSLLLSPEVTLNKYKASASLQLWL